jgi:peptidoglycan/LPS O-acetylase OafA/YrhL
MIPPLGRDPRYKSLDVWRGIACLMVVLDHAGVALSTADAAKTGIESWAQWLVAGSLRLSLGPPMFFVISGYCIAASIDSLRRKRKNPLAFLTKRLWRTYPPYWMALIGLALAITALDRLGLEQLHRGPLGLALDSPRELTAGQWLGNITLTETWRPRVWGGNESIFSRVAWSLCYQEQFYFICFLVVLIAPTRLYSALAALTAAIVAFRVMAWDCGALFRLDGMFPVRWHEFAVGLAVYWRLNAPTTRAGRVGLDLGLVALILLSGRMGLDSTVAAACFGLAMIGFRRWDDAAARLAGLAPLRACGRRCFSIYLVHLPIVSIGTMCLYELGIQSFWGRALVMIPIAFVTSVAVSFLFYRFVESRFASPPALPATASVQLPIAAALAG